MCLQGAKYSQSDGNDLLKQMKCFNTNSQDSEVSLAAGRQPTLSYLIFRFGCWIWPSVSLCLMGGWRIPGGKARVLAQWLTSFVILGNLTPWGVFSHLYGRGNNPCSACLLGSLKSKWDGAWELEKHCANDRHNYVHRQNIEFFLPGSLDSPFTLHTVDFTPLPCSKTFRRVSFLDLELICV